MKNPALMKNRENNGIGDHNFCRNPDNDFRGPWCHTMNPKKRYDYCLESCCPWKSGMGAE